MHKSTESLIVFPEQRAEESPGFLTWQIAMCWQRKVNQQLEECGVTYTQFIVLAVTVRLIQEQRMVYQHQVASQARIDRMMTSRVLGNLETKKLVKRDKLSDDARTNRVSLTKKGEDVIARAVAIVNALEKNFFSAENATEIDLIRGMQRLLPEC